MLTTLITVHTHHPHWGKKKKKVSYAHRANNYTRPLTHHPRWGTIRPPASKLREMETQLLWLKPHLVPSCVAAAAEVSTPWAAPRLPCPPWHQHHLPPGRKTLSQTGPSWKQQHWSLQAACPWVLMQPRMHIYNGQWAIAENDHVEHF